MRSIINELFVVLGAVGDQRSKKDIARIIRREIEIELEDAGLKHENNFKPTNREIQIADSGQKLEAVKLYKNRTGRTVLESKHEIEAHMTINKPKRVGGEEYRVSDEEYAKW